MCDVLSRVVVVQDDFNDFVLCQHKGVCVGTVDSGVGGVRASGEHGVESGDLGTDICDVVEEGAVFVR